MKLRSGTHRHLTETIKDDPVIKCSGIDSNCIPAPKFKSIKDLIHAREQYKRIAKPKHRLLEEDEEDGEEEEIGSRVSTHPAVSPYNNDDIADYGDDVTLMNMTLKEFVQSCKYNKKRKHNTLVDFGKGGDHSPSFVKQEPYEEDVFDLDLPLIKIMPRTPRRGKKRTSCSNLVSEITPKSSECDKPESPSVVKESSTSMGVDEEIQKRGSASPSFSGDFGIGLLCSDGADTGCGDVSGHNSVPRPHSDGKYGSQVPVICVKNEEYMLYEDDVFCEYEKQEYCMSPFKVDSKVDNGSEVSNGDSNEQEGFLPSSTHSNTPFPDSGYEGKMDCKEDLQKEDSFIPSFTPDYPLIHESWDTIDNGFNGNLQVCLEVDDPMDGGSRETSSDNKSFCRPQFEAQADLHNHIHTETLACTEAFISDVEIDPVGDHKAADDLEHTIFSSPTSEFQGLGVLPKGVECLGRIPFSPGCSSSSRDFFLHEFSKSFEKPAPVRDDNELAISPCSVGDHWYPVYRSPEGLTTSMASTSEEKNLCEVTNNGLVEINDDLCRDSSSVSQGSLNVAAEDNPPQIDSMLNGNLSPKLIENGGAITGEPVPVKKKMEGGNHRRALKSSRPALNLPRLSSTSCTTIKGCSQHAVAFAQRQMNDIEMLANKLTKELKHMKAFLKESVQTDQPKTASPSCETMARSAIRNATRVEETAQKWLSIMSRNCDRFCKIMRMPEIGNSAIPNGAKKARKISFADEVGGVLCHVRFFEDDTAAEPDPSLDHLLRTT